MRSNKNVTTGRMMSSPGVAYEGKIFAFFHRGEMGFKAGREFDPASLGLRRWRYLSPYKTKPPMKDWFILTHKEVGFWKKLAVVALRRMMGEFGGR